MPYDPERGSLGSSDWWGDSFGPEDFLSPEVLGHLALVISKPAIKRAVESQVTQALIAGEWREAKTNPALKQELLGKRLGAFAAVLRQLTAMEKDSPNQSLSKRVRLLEKKLDHKTEGLGGEVAQMIARREESHAQAGTTYPKVRRELDVAELSADMNLALAFLQYRGAELNSPQARERLQKAWNSLPEQEGVEFMQLLGEAGLSADQMVVFLHEIDGKGYDASLTKMATLTGPGMANPSEPQGDPDWWHTERNIQRLRDEERRLTREANEEVEKVFGKGGRNTLPDETVLARIKRKLRQAERLREIIRQRERGGEPAAFKREVGRALDRVLPPFLAISLVLLLVFAAYKLAQSQRRQSGSGA